MNKSLQQRYLDALKMGTHTDAFFYMEESLTPDQATMLRRFIGWLGKNEYPIGPVSLPLKFNEFATTARKNDYPAFEARFNEMTQAELNQTKNKADSFVIDNLKPGANIELHKVCYPLKNCTVVSYNPVTKQVTLQLK